MWSNRFSLGSSNREPIPAEGGSISFRSSSYHDTYRAHTPTFRSQLRLPKIAHPSPIKLRGTPPTSLKRKASPPPPITTPPPSTLNSGFLPPPHRPTTITPMKPVFTLPELRQPRILELLQIADDDLCLEHVSIKDFHNWTLENPELEDNNKIHYEYNSLSERFIIKCMATPTHDSLHYFFNQTFSSFLVGKIGSLKASQLFSVGTGTCM